MSNFGNFNCLDCQVNTLDNLEYYMVEDYVWQQSGLDSCEGMLCIRCLEFRIGRKLISSDFPDLPINTQEFFLKSSLFQSRINND
jgi:hypothetical protein